MLFNTENDSRYKTIDVKMWFIVKTCGDNPVTVTIPPLRNADGSPVLRPESEAGYRKLREQRDIIRAHLFDRPYRPNMVDYYGTLSNDVYILILGHFKIGFSLINVSIALLFTLGRPSIDLEGWELKLITKVTMFTRPGSHCRHN